MKSFKKSGLLACCIIMLHISARADVVTDWNQVTLLAAKKAGLNSNLTSRIVAIESIAVYDALNSIQPFGSPYHYFKPPAKRASPTAAIVQAAHDVLSYYFPSQRSYFDSALQAIVLKVTDGPVTTGQNVGAGSAAAIIALRRNDGASPNKIYPANVFLQPGAYRPTPVNFQEGINLQWGRVRPFLLKSPGQFRPGPPPVTDTKSFDSALRQVQEIGRLESKTRTEEQTHIARFYMQDAELTVNEAARSLALLQKKSSVNDHALVLMLTAIAEADARIAIWDAKYFYLFWRPVTALNADPDGAVTNNYSLWSPLLSTPPHPSYPCGHCGTVTAGFGILRHFWGDTNNIVLHTTTKDEAPRKITALSVAEKENSLSRIYGGIHYSFDVAAAEKIGQQVAEYVLKVGPKKLK